jgi:hypothetical protein
MVSSQLLIPSLFNDGCAASTKRHVASVTNVIM